MGLESMILCKLKKKNYQEFILIENFKRVYFEKSFLKSVDVLSQKLMYRPSQIWHTLYAYKIISHNDLFLIFLPTADFTVTKWPFFHAKNRGFHVARHKTFKNDLKKKR